MPKTLDKFLNEFYKAAKESAPREMCGLVIEQNNKQKWILCKNISKNKNTFEIDPNLYTQYMMTSNILYVVHSHYDQEICKPSDYDIDNCNAMDIPYFIVSYPQKSHYLLEPK